MSCGPQLLRETVRRHAARHSVWPSTASKPRRDRRARSLFRGRRSAAEHGERRDPSRRALRKSEAWTAPGEMTSKVHGRSRGALRDVTKAAIPAATSIYRVFRPARSKIRRKRGRDRRWTTTG